MFGLYRVLKNHQYQTKKLSEDLGIARVQDELRIARIQEELRIARVPEELRIARVQENFDKRAKKQEAELALLKDNLRDLIFRSLPNAIDTLNEFLAIYGGDCKNDVKFDNLRERYFEIYGEVCDDIEEAKFEKKLDRVIKHEKCDSDDEERDSKDENFFAIYGQYYRDEKKIFSDNEKFFIIYGRKYDDEEEKERFRIKLKRKRLCKEVEEIYAKIYDNDRDIKISEEYCKKYKPLLIDFTQTTSEHPQHDWVCAFCADRNYYGDVSDDEKKTEYENKTEYYQKKTAKIKEDALYHATPSVKVMESIVWLDCLHSYHYGCLEDFINSNSSDDQIKCPQCNKKIDYKKRVHSTPPVGTFYFKKIQTKRNATKLGKNKRSTTKRSATKPSKTLRSATKRSATKRSATKRSATKRSASKRSKTVRSASKRSKTVRSASKRSATKRSKTKRSATKPSKTKRSATVRSASKPSKTLRSASKHSKTVRSASKRSKTVHRSNASR